jgi:hypothetical protein
MLPEILLHILSIRVPFAEIMAQKSEENWFLNSAPPRESEKVCQQPAAAAAKITVDVKGEIRVSQSGWRTSRFFKQKTPMSARRGWRAEVGTNLLQAPQAAFAMGGF